ncbi:MAG: DUF5989 family protein [Saprospiraceae bacterium]
MIDLLTDLWGYLKNRKKFWLAPVILILVFIGLILIFGAATGLSPFIYSLFKMKEANRDILISALAFVFFWYLSNEIWVLLIAAIYLISCWFLPFLKNLNHQF